MSATLHVSGHASKQTVTVDHSRLHPEDAYYAQSPPRERARSPLGLGANGATIRGSDPRRSRTKEGRRVGSRRRKGAWAKLLWVKQSYPDNYTDEYTFLDHLQRNPRLQPYEFWRLVSDSTVIVQHVCSVAIFLCCFTGIFQERISPMTVVTYSSVATVAGWMLCDFWVGQHDKEAKLDDVVARDAETSPEGSAPVSCVVSKDGDATNGHATNGHATASRPSSSHASGLTAPVGHPTGASTFAAYTTIPPYGDRGLYFSPRAQKRLATVKSSILIYCALLGLSPILKSLTKSTTSDSIWALSSWLMCINVAFFDYGGGVGAK
jgi:phosphatidylinositol N-acetylglucosaminyltransferase subunit C